MQKYLKVVKNPTESAVIMVTKKDIVEMKEKYPSISMGNHDREYLKDFSAGDLKYFNEHYTIIEDTI